MKSRGTVIGIALLLALAATGAVAMYVRNVEDRSTSHSNQVQVIVAKQDIIAGERLDELLSSGAFTTETVPEDSLVEGAITSLDELEGKTTSSPIVKGEQITAARIEGSGQLPGGTLGIPAGHVAVDVAIPAPAALFGDLVAGDRVTVYASFGESASVTLPGQNGSSATISGEAAATVSIVPDVQVLALHGNVPDGSSSFGGTTTRLDDLQLAVTLALRPNDAQKVVFAEQHGAIHLALIPPGEKGEKQRPLSITDLVRR